MRRHHDADGLRASIREHVSRDVDWIKLYASITPDLRIYVAGEMPAYSQKSSAR